jgi:AcrR family transcriptional regulator
MAQRSSARTRRGPPSNSGPEEPAPPPASLGIRARARTDTVAQIKRIAREHLARQGTALSLRAVARDLGVVSSAVYRYFDSREALLAALADDALASLGEAVRAAEARAPRRDLASRWMALARAVRGWALEHPHEFGLLYGGPAGGGVAAPSGSSEGPLAVIVGLVAETASRGTAAGSERVPRAVRAAFERVAGNTPLPAPAVGRAVTAWCAVVGAVNLELSGRSAMTAEDAEAAFEFQVRGLAGYLGLSR